MRKIIVDAMGGEHAPKEIVKGAAEASLCLRSAEIILVGDAEAIGKILPEHRHDGGRVRVHHASEYVHMDDMPAEAIVARPDSSIVVAAELVGSGSGDALVTAGNTGAAILACTRSWKRLEGVPRAALAAVYPTELRRGEKNDPFSLILDVGAAVDADAHDLVTFAMMGATYARIVSRNPRPRVALLSSGGESVQGPAAVVQAHERLLEATGLNFIGTIEGVDIPRGVADVIVCSGYVGNVVVKMLEGVSETVVNLARYAYKDKLMGRAAVGVLSSGLSRLKGLTDWEQYAGAPLLGFQQPLIDVNGCAKARAITNAIMLADKALRAELCGTIKQGLAEL